MKIGLVKIFKQKQFGETDLMKAVILSYPKIVNNKATRTANREMFPQATNILPSNKLIIAQMNNAAVKSETKNVKINMTVLIMFPKNLVTKFCVCRFLFPLVE